MGRKVSLCKTPCKVGVREGLYFGSQVVEDNQRARIKITLLRGVQREPMQRGYKASRKRKVQQE